MVRLLSTFADGLLAGDLCVTLIDYGLLVIHVADGLLGDALFCYRHRR